VDLTGTKGDLSTLIPITTFMIKITEGDEGKKPTSILYITKTLRE